MKRSRAVIIGAVAAVAVGLFVQQSASAATYIYANTYSVPKNTYLTSATYTSDGGSGIANGGGGWDLTFKIGAINSSGSYISAATSPGWAGIGYQNELAQVRSRCYWYTSQPLGSGDKVPLTCRIFGVSGPFATTPTAVKGSPNLKALQAPRTAADSLPGWVKPEILGIDPASARHLYTGSEADYWVASTELNKTCLVTLSTDGNHNAAASCTDPTTFNERGLALRLDSSGVIGNPAYLVPDSVISTGRSVPGATNLIVLDNAAKAAESANALTTATGAQFPLVPLNK
jgi:hypothetical protein